MFLALTEVERQDGGRNGYKERLGCGVASRSLSTDQAGSPESGEHSDLNTPGLE